MTTQVNIVHVNPATLKHLPTRNPNVMDPQEYEALVKGIKQYGFLQPILVLDTPGGHTIVDGVHRSKAAAEVGLDSIPALLASDAGHAEILRIAMNKIRGQLDVSEVGRQLQILLDTGFTEDELTLTGFASWEIDAMLEAMQEDDDDLGQVDVSPISDKPKTFNLTLKFDSESERARARERLEELGEGDITHGLEAALTVALPEEEN